MQLTSKVPVAFHGQNIVDYLATRFTYQSKAQWLQLVEDGQITLNGVACEISATINKRDVIGCTLPDFPAPDVNLDYSIIHEDEWLLAVDKPAGLRVHSGGKFVKANLIYHLRHQHKPPYPEAHLVNRLDAGTSGLVLLARDEEIRRKLMQQFSAGEVEKSYLAVVSGQPKPAAGTIVLVIGPVEGAKVPRFWVEDGSIGVGVVKPALTEYRLLRKLSDEYSLMELKPVTGRTHQLRVHMAAIGHPIVGDALYWMDDDAYIDFVRNLPERKPGQMIRPALHSYQLMFTHPVSEIRCTLTAPLAEDIEEFIEWAVAGCGE